MMQKLPYVALLIITFIFSCGPTRNITYLSNLGNSAESTSQVVQQSNIIIQPDDLLSITVTSLSVESNAIFNATSSTGVEQITGYLVNDEGFIDFPLIGAVQLAGLTKAAATETLIKKLNEHVRRPIVNIRFLNFKVTVLGEVNRPSSFNIQSDNINIFEALGLAGDMTVFGKRENVLLIREKNNKRTTVRLNLNDKEILNSPYFYLQQNDIIYIEPDEAKAAQTNIRRSNFQFGFAIGTSIVSIVLLLLTRL
jgi:polysaccharide biosynthesis/export protein